MSVPPQQPKIYHITHMNNIPAIIRSGYIFSDAKCIEDMLDRNIVGMSAIKQRRLHEIEVTCHAGTKVGQYVPFYFCPRSIMLYILHCGNHADINYTEGQRPIVHLQADLHATVRWADQRNVIWAFSDRNAGGYLAEFYADPGDLDKIDWPAVAETDFRDMQTKEGKQAEFLTYESFPWSLVERIGAKDVAIVAKVQQMLQEAEYKPLVTIEPAWYY